MGKRILGRERGGRNEGEEALRLISGAKVFGIDQDQRPWSLVTCFPPSTCRETASEEGRDEGKGKGRESRSSLPLRNGYEKNTDQNPVNWNDESLPQYSKASNERQCNISL